jgi:hypothetical protein
MAKVIIGNVSAITVPRQDRDSIRKIYSDVLGGKIVKEDDDNVEELALKILDFGASKLDLPSGLPESVPYL